MSTNEFIIIGIFYIIFWVLTRLINLSVIYLMNDGKHLRDRQAYAPRLLVPAFLALAPVIGELTFIPCTIALGIYLVTTASQGIAQEILELEAPRRDIYSEPIPTFKIPYDERETEIIRSVSLSDYDEDTEIWFQ